jgi:hypothetical protein
MVFYHVEEIFDDITGFGRCGFLQINVSGIIPNL